MGRSNDRAELRDRDGTEVGLEGGGADRYCFIEQSGHDLGMASRNIRDMAAVCLATSAVKRMQPTNVSQKIDSTISSTASRSSGASIGSERGEMLSGEATDVALVRFADGVRSNNDFVTYTIMS